MATLEETMTVQPTFILANVFERKLVAIVLALHDADLAKGAFADHSQQSKVVEVDLVGKDYWLSV